MCAHLCMATVPVLLTMMTPHVGLDGEDGGDGGTLEGQHGDGSQQVGS